MLAVVVLLAVLGGAITAAVVALRPDPDAVVQVRRGINGPEDLPAGLRVQPTSRWVFRDVTVEPRWAEAAEGDVYVIGETESGLELIRLAGVDGTVVWRTPLDAGEVRSIDIEHGTVLVAMVRGDDATIQVFDAGDGSQRSSSILADGMDIFASLSDDGRYVVGVVAGEQGAPQVLTLSDGGELVWTGGMDALAVEGASALVRDGASVALIDVATGDEHWSTAAPDDAVVALVGGQAFLASRQEVVAYDLTGAELWRQAVPADAPESIIGQGGDSIVVVRTNGVVALSTADGAQRWEAPPGGVIGDTAGTALTLRSTEEDVTFRVVDGEDGSTKATRILGPAEGVALAADVIYVGDGVGVTAYDRVSLAPLWSTVVADDGNGLVVEAVEGGVLVRAGDGSLVVLR